MPRKVRDDCPECGEGEIVYKRWDNYRMKGGRDNKLKTMLMTKECSECGASEKEIREGLKKQGHPL